MSEASVPLSAVLDWLTRTDRETVAGLIAGRALDDGDSDETFAIHGLDWSDAGKPVALVLRDGRRLPVRRLAATAHLVDRRPGAPLSSPGRPPGPRPGGGCAGSLLGLGKVGPAASAQRESNFGRRT